MSEFKILESTPHAGHIETLPGQPDNVEYWTSGILKVKGPFGEFSSATATWYLNQKFMGIIPINNKVAIDLAKQFLERTGKKVNDDAR